MIEWEITLIVTSGNGIPFNLKISLSLKEDELTEKECIFLSEKIREYVNTNEDYTFGYEPSCIGLNKPKKTFRTQISKKYPANTDDDDYNKLVDDFVDNDLDNILEFIEKQREKFNEKI